MYGHGSSLQNTSVFLNADRFPAAMPRPIDHLALASAKGGSYLWRAPAGSLVLGLRKGVRYQNISMADNNNHTCQSEALKDLALK